MMAELYGRVTGYCRGKGGTMHLADPDNGVIAANGIVGGGLPLAVGAALVCKLRGSGVAVAFFGEGASTTGAFHESVNLAALWNLPVLFVCENNRYVEYTPVSSVLNRDHVSDLAPSYDMEAVRIDGNDIVGVLGTAGELVGRLRAGEGPFLLELETYRFKGHHEGDPEVYRTRDEIDQQRKGDPLLRARAAVVELGQATDEWLEEIDREIAHEIDEAVAFARSSPTPGPEELLLHV
jgi:pyruvate dehydrogenase E1 component alpha subunit